MPPREAPFITFLLRGDCPFVRGSRRAKPGSARISHLSERSEVGGTAARLHRPVVALLDDEAIGPEAEQGDARERLLLAVGRHDGPVLDCGAVSVDHRFAEAALDELLVRERAQRVVASALLGLAERV